MPTRSLQWFLCVALCVLAGAFGGCGDDGVGDEPDGAVADASGLADAAPDAMVSNYPYPIEGVTVNWVTCSLYEGTTDARAECAMVGMPRRWDDPSAGTAWVMAKRLLATEPAEAQVWFLHGGPGASGTFGLSGLMEHTQQGYPQADVYTIDARGTGWSDYLDCPDQESPQSEGGTWITTSELAGCVAYLETTRGDDLATFSTTHAAIDLAAFIYHTKEPGKRVLMWGGSGGTFWAQRFLQIFPELVDGVVMEGIVPGVDSTLAVQDEHDDWKTREILSLCSQDTQCASRLPDAENQLVALLSDLDAGHCANLGVTSDLLKQMLRSLGYYGPNHAIIPALIGRLVRCDPGDEQALVNLYQVMWGGTEPTEAFSNVIFLQQMSSELWLTSEMPTPQDVVDYLDGVYENTIISFGMGYDRHEVYLGWPVYDDPYDDQWASSDVPILMLQGQLDPSTPHEFALNVAANFNGANQTWVAFPHAAHNVRGATPTGTDPSAVDCAESMFLAFLRDPQGTPDTSCVASVLPPDFEGEDIAPYVMGTPNYWDNPSNKGAIVPLPGMPGNLREVIRRLRLLQRSQGGPYLP